MANPYQRLKTPKEVLSCLLIRQINRQSLANPLKLTRPVVTMELLI